jgi:hypothetical protein
MLNNLADRFTAGPGKRPRRLDSVLYVAPDFDRMTAFAWLAFGLSLSVIIGVLVGCRMNDKNLGLNVRTCSFSTLSALQAILVSSTK